MTTQSWTIKTLCLSLAAAWLGSMATVSAEQPVFKPGALLKLYELKRGTEPKVVQDGEPLFETVDRSGEFQASNFRNREGISLPKGKPVAAKWEGYLKVGREGDYLFLAGPKSGYTTVIILINNERLLQATKSRDPETATINLQPGVHQIKLWVAGSHGSEKSAASVQWRHKDDKAFKELTPGSLLYREK